MDDIYNSRILEFAGNIPRNGRLDPADAEASAHSKLCGSKVKVTIRLAEGHITDFAHDVKACALGQASSSIMARNIVGASVEEVRAAREAMLTMLKADGEGPEGRFEDMRILRPVRDYKARHASTMLTFDAVVDAIGQVEAARLDNRVEKGKRLKMCDGKPECRHEDTQPAPYRGRNWRGPFPRTPGRLAGMALIRLYQLTLSGFVGNGCRHIPTCSEYGYEAIARHGLWPGGWMTLYRIARCGPGGKGGLDPVPLHLGGRLRWLAPWRRSS